MLQQFPVIVGPTAGGKSALGLALAQTLDPVGEIVSADSMQVYKGMDIGTAKPSAADQAQTPHHLIDLIEPDESFSVDQWLRLANETIDEIRTRGRTPIVVGGTHLYVQALLYGLFQGPPADETLRAELANHPPAELRAELERIDPEAALRIHANDSRRTIRAIEVFRATGRPISEFQREWENHPPRADTLLVGLSLPTEITNGRVNARVKAMIDQGLVEEVRSLWEAGKLGPQAQEALGYKQLVNHFEGRGSLEDAIERIKIETRRFAKNQRTWLRRLRATPGALWIDAAEVEGQNCAQTFAQQVIREIRTRANRPG